MSYVQIQDIRLGMDRRRASRVVAELGSAWTIKNAHLTRGGDIERRKSFVKMPGQFPSTTKGLYAVNETLYTVGYDATEAANVPNGVTHLLTQHPTPATALTASLDAEAFDGVLYNVSQFEDGSIYHFYGAVRVTDWDSLSSDIASNDAVADALQAAIDNSQYVSASATTNVITVTAATPGTAFTISGAAVNKGDTDDQQVTIVETQSNVPGVSEVLASADIQITGGTNSPGVNTISSITVNGVEILGSTINWETSHTVTASAIAAQIAAYGSIPDYSVSSSGDTVTIKAAVGTGSAPNGFAVSVTVNGDVTHTSDASLSGGVDAVQGIAQVNTVTIEGTFETADQFYVVINGTETYQVTGGASGMGTTALTFKQKLYSTAASNLYFSDLNGPTVWVGGLDSGFINMASQTAGQETLTAIQEYQGLMAVFSRNTTRIWSISEDSGANVLLQTLHSTGTIAPKSVKPYGNNDVFYLDTSGIRSIKARDSSNAAYVSDVGTSIDTHVREYINTLTEQVVSEAVAVIEPIDGRYWMAIGKRIYVLSFFPSAKISAFSYYDLDFRVTDFAKIDDRIYARGVEDNGDEFLYLYGGTDNATYPSDNEDEVLIELPYISAQNPAAFKELIGFDIIAINNWEVEILPDPADDTKKIHQGVAAGTTYGEPRYAVTGNTPLFAVNLTCKTGGKAVLSALALHYTGVHEDG